jgi:preprotein translocase subunit SecG
LDLAFLRVVFFVALVELHALANATKRPIWWKRLGNAFILQHSPSRVASLGLNVDRKWAAIFFIYIAPARSWTQDLLALIPCKTACSSQCDQKTDLMKETRQCIYTSTALNSTLSKTTVWVTSMFFIYSFFFTVEVRPLH